LGGGFRPDFFGGDDSPSSLVIHPITGEVFVAGGTSSENFPGTAGGAQPFVNIPGPETAGFVARLNAALTTLNQATYVGGTESITADTDVGGLAIDPSSGGVFAGGHTGNDDFPGRSGAAQSTFGGGDSDAFIERLNSALTTLEQSTYLGGSGSESI